MLKMSAAASLCLVLAATCPAQDPIDGSGQDPAERAEARVVEHRPSRNLPDDRTLFTLEIPDPALLWDLRGELFQLRLLESRQLQEYLDSMTEAGSVDRMLGRKEAFAKFFSTFDRGLTFASVFAPDEEPNTSMFLSNWVEPWNCLIGASSSSDAVRALPSLVRSIVEAGGDELETVELPLLDSPIAVRSLGASVYDAYRSRRAAFAFCGSWSRKEASKRAAFVVGEALGLVSRGNPRRYAEVPAGERVVARMRYTPSAFDAYPESFMAKTAGARSILGIDCFRSIDGRLVLDESGDERALVDRVDITRVPETESILDTLRTGARSRLRALAKYLPSDTVCAVTFPTDGEKFCAQLRAFNEVLAFFEVDEVIADMRQQLGFELQADAPGLKELHAITIAIVPGSAEGDDPEAIVFVQGAHSKDAVRIVLEPLLDLPPGEPASKASGRGMRSEGPVHWVPYAKPHRGTGGYRDIFGGERLAITVLGDSLVLGSNAATLGRLHEQDEKTSLQANAVFVREFGAAEEASKGARSVMAGFVDGPSFVRAVGARQDWFPMMRFFGLMPSESAVRRIDFDALAKLASRERFELLRTKTGHRFEHSGGTLLSPVVWSSVGCAAYLAQVLNSIRR